MNKHRKHYWSCSKFSNFIQNQFGLKKPTIGTLYEWKSYEHESKNCHPLVTYITEDLFDKAQDVVYFPYDVYKTCTSYFKNRFITKTHYLKTKLKPGQWYDLDHRMLHALFEELVDFVEIEKASMEYFCNKNLYHKFKKHWYREFRSKELGIAYLNWEESLSSENNNDMGQSIKAKEIKELYNWWTYGRPNRVDPYIAANIVHDNDNFTAMNFFNEDNSKKYKMVNEIEQRFEDEDQEMLVRLIKIRKGLWT